MMLGLAPSKTDKAKEAIPQRRVLRTTGVVAGAGITAALLITTPVGAQQTLDFGEVIVGSSETRAVSQPNPTDQPLPITGIAITGLDADQFSVVDDDAPFTLQPNESRTVAIGFTPTSAGEKSAAVQVEIAGRTSQTAGQLTGTRIDEAADQNEDGSTVDDSASSSSSQGMTVDESSSDTAHDATTSDDVSATEPEDGTGDSDGASRSTRDESSTEDLVAPTSNTDGSKQPANERSSILLMLGFNGNGIVDFQDILTLIRVLS